jgi:LPS-assembly protein
MKPCRVNTFTYIFRSVSVALFSIVIGCGTLLAAEMAKPYKEQLSTTSASGYTLPVSSKTLVKTAVIPPVNPDEVTIQARTLDYDQENKYVVAQGSITVTWQDKILNCEYLEFWTDREYMVARGSVTFADSKNTLYCNTMVYDNKSHTAEVDKVSGLMAPWYFATNSMKKNDEKTYVTGKMNMTTCDASSPHYIIRASKAKITTGKRITIYNAVFYIRKVPIFYLPIFSQPLNSGGGGHGRSLEIITGYNSTDGVMIKAIYGGQLSKYAYGKLYLDYYELRGWGQGAEYDYNNPNLRGSIYVYHIKESNTGNENLNVKISHWQKLDAQWTSRSNINYVNSTTFGTQYLQDNWALFQRQIDSSLSFTRQTRQSNLTLSASRTDTSDATTGQFVTTSLLLPQITYTRFSLLNKSPYNSTLNATYQNSYIQAGDYYDESAFTKVDIKRSYAFLRKKLSITPLLAISENWDDAQNVNVSSFTTRYISNLNLRYHFSSAFTWDLGYSYTLRSQANSLGVDSDAADYGAELNQLNAQNLFYYGRVNIKSTVSYNLQRNRGEVIYDWREKFSPLVNELTWLPSHSLTLYVKETNNIYLTYADAIDSDYLRSVQTIVTLGQLDDQYVSLGAFYQADQPDNLGFNTSFGYRPNAKWKIDYRLVGNAIDNFNSFVFDDQQISVYRNLHCWEVKATFRKMLTGASEIFFQLNLTASNKSRKILYNQQFEKEFYPWR